MKTAEKISESFLVAGYMVKGHSRITWEDLYHDGYISEHDEFCEDTQTIYRRKRNDNDGWDKLEEYKSSKKYWKQVDEDYKGVKY